MMPIEQFHGRGRRTFGVRLGDEGESRTKWLRAMASVFTAKTAVKPEVRESLLALNADLLNGMSIDYGAGSDLGEEISGYQRSLVESVLREIGLCSGVDYGEVEYDGILGGPGAFFHVDKCFGAPGVLFVVTSILGGGEFVMPNIGWATAFEVGRTVMFDPLEVHGLCVGAGEKAGGCGFLSVSSQVSITMQGCAKLGLLVPEGGCVDIDELLEDSIEPGTGEYLSGL
ncbi:hypothetical protein [Ottowia sp.]|uniref:hypothetical protein n=1 Tax=Ottowia sp. TaxID=1898956 RepID=UPI0025FC100F|nr:hypothetical protein [Ottowia sp.]MBK6616494.1 hypothetical protein [Ottowia sp.]